MKKLLFVAAVAFFGSAVAVKAQETAAPSTEAVATEQQDEKVKINADELPQSVKTALEAQEYKGWLVNAAYHDKKADTYEVELKNGAETQTLKFDKEGKKVD